MKHLTASNIRHGTISSTKVRVLEDLSTSALQQFINATITLKIWLKIKLPTLTCWVRSSSLLYSLRVLSYSSCSIWKSMYAFHSTSGMSSLDWLMASSYIASALSVSPRIVSNSAYYNRHIIHNSSSTHFELLDIFFIFVKDMHVPSSKKYSFLVQTPGTFHTGSCISQTLVIVAPTLCNLCRACSLDISQ